MLRSMSDAAIAIASGKAAGKRTAAPLPSLPAAQQTRQPCATAALSALWIELLFECVPRLRLITAAAFVGKLPEELPRRAAKRIACAMSTVEPVPSTPSARHSTSSQSQLMPAIPLALFPFAPIVPEQCEPWFELSKK